MREFRGNHNEGTVVIYRVAWGNSLTLLNLSSSFRKWGE